jgi:hypothetical protein
MLFTVVELVVVVRFFFAAFKYVQLKNKAKPKQTARTELKRKKKEENVKKKQSSRLEHLIIYLFL